MKTVVRAAMLLLLLAGSSLALGQIANFRHVVVMVQENRTPDNLFQGLCRPPYGRPSACGTGTNQFDIQGYGFNANGTQVPLAAVPLGNPYDPGHTHASFEAMCNANTTTYFPCVKNTRLSTTNCPLSCSFEYVDPTTTPTIHPYLYLAQHFGWANRMFQTNQGPSTPAHQFLFSGTSAPSAADDAAARFITENPSGLGCLAPLDSIYKEIDPSHAPAEYNLINNPLGTVCFSHDSLPTLLEKGKHTWRYYTVGTVKSGISNNIWTAPNWIRSICEPNSTFTQCTGAEWIDNVDLTPADVLTDVQNCKLKNMVWVIPIGQNSDHPSQNLANHNDGGPAWVANVINGVASSTCTDTINGLPVPYWQDTAIIVVWDDWGGFYDHVLPPFLSAPSQGQGDYQMGFRVPLIFVSAYTVPTIDSTNRYDFGSILRFVERNFSITEGTLGFADRRSTTDLRVFFNLKLVPKKFHIPTTVSAQFFLNDTRPPEPPDTD